MTSRGVCAAICAVVTGMATLSWAQVPGPNNAITDVPGIRVGHFTANQTGTTVVLAGDSSGQGVAGGITQRGGSPGTRETDLLKPENMVQIVNAITLSGGGAYGLAAASGVMRCLEGQGIGFPVGGGNVVPIVPAAVSFDAGQCQVGASRPDLSFGLQACQNAASSTNTAKFKGRCFLICMFNPASASTLSKTGAAPVLTPNVLAQGLLGGLTESPTTKPTGKSLSASGNGSAGARRCDRTLSNSDT